MQVVQRLVKIMRIPTEPDVVSQPTARFWARLLDFNLAYLILRLVFPPWSPMHRTLSGKILTDVLITAMMLLMDLALLPAWGCTPGKWIMGLRVEREHGEPPGLRYAWVRTGHLWLRGFGLGIPILSFVTRLIAFADILRPETPSWDRLSGCTVTYRPITWRRVAGFVLMIGLVLVCVLALDSRIPPVSWRTVSDKGFSIQFPYFAIQPEKKLTTADLPNGTMYIQYLDAPNFWLEGFILHQFEPYPQDAAKSPQQLLRDVRDRGDGADTYTEQVETTYGRFPMLTYTDPGDKTLHRIIRTPKYVYHLWAPVGSKYTKPFMDSLRLGE